MKLLSLQIAIDKIKTLLPNAKKENKLFFFSFVAIHQIAQTSHHFRNSTMHRNSVSFIGRA